MAKPAKKVVKKTVAKKKAVPAKKAATSGLMKSKQTSGVAVARSLAMKASVIHSSLPPRRTFPHAYIGLLAFTQ